MSISRAKGLNEIVGAGRPPDVTVVVW